MKHDYLLLGEVERPQGIHGEVKLKMCIRDRG